MKKTIRTTLKTIVQFTLNHTENIDFITALYFRMNCYIQKIQIKNVSPMDTPEVEHQSYALRNYYLLTTWSSSNMYWNATSPVNKLALNNP